MRAVMEPSKYRDEDLESHYPTKALKAGAEASLRVRPRGEEHDGRHDDYAKANDAGVHPRPQVGMTPNRDDSHGDNGMAKGPVQAPTESAIRSKAAAQAVFGEPQAGSASRAWLSAIAYLSSCHGPRQHWERQCKARRAACESAAAQCAAFWHSRDISQAEIGSPEPRD